MKRVRLVIVTGLSGSGRTSALKVLEDLGFFCVDNLPVVLLPKFLELGVLAGHELQKVALGMDVRERTFLEQCREKLEEIQRMGVKAEVLYLEAADDVLVRRFSETRRRHPLSEEKSVSEGIRAERELFADVKEMADLVIDTSAMSVHDLKKSLWQYFQQGPEDHRLRVNLVSFGYRFGIPVEADLVMDVRFLPNPYFVPDLKSHLGTEKPVQDFVFGFEESREFFRRFSELLEFLLPYYEKEGKTYVTVAVGCTGGRHRSVAMVEELKRFLEGKGRGVRVLHRDSEK
ncbi:MAG: RNase adapter RapZ [Deltaproteobacteria bacterium]|nr:RNase adapter RapZ [Deltaproteobacteria bacterium]